MRLWHGSPANLKIGDYLVPKYSPWLNDKYVFGTPIKDWAVLFGALASYLIECGVLKRIPFIVELRENELKTLSKPCYLYIVEGDFKDDSRLSMRGVELVSKKKAKIIAKYKISDVFSYIKRKKYFKIVTFEEHLQDTHKRIKKIK